jgi:outer membrane protein, multidrug efflux system
VVSRPLRRLVLAAPFVIAGCTVGPDYRLPEHALINAPPARGPLDAAHGRSFSLDAPPSDWWRLYQDPVLDRLVRQALAGNTDLRVADANLERSRALLREARDADEPNLAINFDMNYRRRSAEAYVHAGEIPVRLLYDTGISISYDVDLFGRIRRGIEAARDENEAIEAARDLARVNVAAETTRAYADLCGAGHELAAARRSVGLQRDAYAMTRQLVQGGRGVSFDVTRQQVQVDQVLATVPLLLARQQNALYRLASLTGRPPEEADRTLLACDTPPRLDRPLPVGDGAALLRRRPDIRAAERRLAASTAQIGVATAALYPDVRLGASIGSTGATQDFLSSLTNRYGIGPSISWQLNQSVPRARIAQARGEQKAELARFDGIVLSALRETESALTFYRFDLTRLRNLQQARDRAADVARDAGALQAAGRIGALAVLDVQRTLAIAEENLAAAQTRISMDQVAVFLALGGGWQTAGNDRPRSMSPAASPDW